MIDSLGPMLLAAFARADAIWLLFLMIVFACFLCWFPAFAAPFCRHKLFIAFAVHKFSKPCQKQEWVRDVPCFVPSKRPLEQLAQCT